MRLLGTPSAQELVSPRLSGISRRSLSGGRQSVLVSAENYADIRLRLTRAGLASNSEGPATMGKPSCSGDSSLASANAWRASG